MTKAVLKEMLRFSLLIYSLWKAMNLTQNLKRIKSHPDGESKPYSLAGTNSVIKIILNHTHILRTLFMFPYDWSYEFGEAINATFGMLSPRVSNSLSMDCLLKSMKNKIEYLYFKVFSQLLLPLFVGIIFIFLLFLKAYMSKRVKFQKNNTNHLRRTAFSIANNSLSEGIIIRKIVKSVRRNLSIEAVFIIVFMMSWVDIAHSVGFTLFYVNIGHENSKSKRLLWQPNIRFDSPQHMQWVYFLSIPSIVIFGFLFPAYIVYR